MKKCNRVLVVSYLVMGQEKTWVNLEVRLLEALVSCTPCHGVCTYTSIFLPHISSSVEVWLHLFFHAIFPKNLLTLLYSILTILIHDVFL